jgi:hypothetical protein
MVENLIQGENACALGIGIATHGREWVPAVGTYALLGFCLARKLWGICVIQLEWLPSRTAGSGIHSSVVAYPIS